MSTIPIAHGSFFTWPLAPIDCHHSGWGVVERILRASKTFIQKKFTYPTMMTVCIGRFLQEDPHPGKVINPISVINKYTYAGNNPVMNVDPTGEIFFAFAAILFSGTLAGVVGGMTFAAALAGSITAAASIAIGAAIGASIATAFGHGDLISNFESIFNFSAAAFSLMALSAAAFGGGATAVGGNGLAGYVTSAEPLKASIGPWTIGGQGGGLALGNSVMFNGVSPLDIVSGTTANFANHEFGHVLQFMALQAFGTTVGKNAYIGFGVLGMTPAGSWFEESASFGGTRDAIF